MVNFFPMSCKYIYIYIIGESVREEEVAEFVNLGFESSFKRLHFSGITISGLETLSRLVSLPVVWQENPCLLVLTVANPPCDHDPNVWDGTLQFVKYTPVQGNFSHSFRQQMLEMLRWMGIHSRGAQLTVEKGTLGPRLQGV